MILSLHPSFLASTIRWKDKCHGSKLNYPRSAYGIPSFFSPRRFCKLWNTSCSSRRSDAKNLQGFSVLSPDIPWQNRDIWSIMAFYFFTLHVPLGFGSASVVAEILHQPNLDPQTKVSTLLIAQMIDFGCALALLKYSAKTEFNLFKFLYGKKQEGRNWIYAVVVGLGTLLLLVAVTNLISERFIDHEVVQDPVLKEILSSGVISLATCFFLYCFITPLLEETIYRGFLLSSLASTTKWQNSVVISSFIFSAAHLSGENFVQLFLIGYILGCAYCWSGNLASSFAIHSLYNALILTATLLS